MSVNTETAIWERLIRPDRSNLPPLAARALLKLDFDRKDRNRLKKLAAKAQAGSLTAKEEAELENYRRVGSLLDLIRSKARRSLRRST